MRPGVRLAVDGEGLLRDGEKSQQYGAYGGGESRVKRTEHKEEFFWRVGFSAQRKDLHMHAKPAESAFGTQNRQREFARRGKAAARDLCKQHQGGQNSFVRNKSRGNGGKPRKERHKGADREHGLGAGGDAADYCAGERYLRQRRAGERRFAA